MLKIMRSFCLSVVVLISAPLHGQGGDTEIDVKRRNNCRLAAQVLRSGHPHPHWDWALRYIARCEGEGPAALASVWRTAPASGEMDRLVWSTLRLRDARLYQQLRETATDRSRPGPLRVAAMLVLTRYTDPRNAVWLTDLVPPDSITRIPLVGSSGTGYFPIEGDVPLTGPIAESVLALLDEVAAARDSEQEAVWYAAAVLGRRLRRDIEAGFAN